MHGSRLQWGEEPECEGLKVWHTLQDGLNYISVVNSSVPTDRSCSRNQKCKGVGYECGVFFLNGEAEGKKKKSGLIKEVYGV